ncbi:protein phosphatase 1G isoform X2 [Ahaetulla prasina]|uniref:protein phosphatase 1G isoform X2 n=1 Tax=Ahaetulla prasina TaxID=499056 RepID=UPI0026484CD8|nr:protein phosphatase 1G isoform X2 [Ahaetulla prasina]
MGAYLSQPSTAKSSGDGVGIGPRPLHFGYSAMQGWRVSMEDAHNCIPDLDSETAMFSVYDGHGGEEVALYCAKYLPEIIKDQKAYKEGKLQKALEDAFLAIDAKLTMEEVIKELALMSGRSRDEGDEKEMKVADEDDVDNEETALLHEEAAMTIEELLTRYGQNCVKGKLGPPGKDVTQEDAQEPSLNGEVDAEEPSRRHKEGEEEEKNGKLCSEAINTAHGPDVAGGGDAGTCQKKTAEGASPASGEMEPSCSSASKSQQVIKSMFFEDSEDESEDAEEEEDDDSEPGSDSGTTAVVALIRGKQLIVANAGDSRCVVSEGGKAVDMSYDHKPEDEVESARIKNAGGKVTMDGRVNGGLNLSRAIGDHFYKRNKNLPPEEQMISALPDIKVLTINDDHDFMVIACDGIWNVMSSQEVVDFVHSKITQKSEDGELRSLSSIVEELLDRCLAPDTSGDGTGCDNMTCIIISFKPHINQGSPAESSKRKLEDSTTTSPTEEGCSKKARQD